MIMIMMVVVVETFSFKTYNSEILTHNPSPITLTVTFSIQDCVEGEKNYH